MFNFVRRIKSLFKCFKNSFEDNSATSLLQIQLKTFFEILMIISNHQYFLSLTSRFCSWFKNLVFGLILINDDSPYIFLEKSSILVLLWFNVTPLVAQHNYNSICLKTHKTVKAKEYCFVIPT